MFSHRLFNIVIAVALLVVIGVSVREVSATSVVVSQTNTVDPACKSLPSASSIRSEYVKERGVWMTYSDDGPTGMDGGLIYLFSADRACSE